MRKGKIEIISGEGKYKGVVIAAPHGSHDKHTDEIVRALCDKLRVCGVIASDFVDRDSGRRVNMNRPTEGAGVSPKEETLTSLSARLYHRYLKSVLKACGGYLDLYVEVHGNEHPELARRIEVATWNVSQQEAVAMKHQYMDMRGRLFPNLAKARISMWVEGTNPIEKRAWANKLFGILPLSQAALHFELPKAAREGDARDETITALTQVIYQWSKDQ